MRETKHMLKSTDRFVVRRIETKNFLSFGPENPGLDLGPLNVLIGPNGSGKSNLIEAIRFIRAAPDDISEIPRKGGGVAEWIWKGSPDGQASAGWTVSGIDASTPLRHLLAFGHFDQRFSLRDERITSDLSLFRRTEDGVPFVVDSNYVERDLKSAAYELNRSVLAQVRDPDAYPEFAWLVQNYQRIHVYREWHFGGNAIFRQPQRADMPNVALEEDFSNLGLYLNRLKTRFPVAKRAILKGLADLYAGITDFDVLIEGGTVQVFFTEGDFTIPATRLSDGTLRYLCLLAILCDPEPPPLICIEEPELGLHPDVLPGLADLLRAASERTQLIVTTHSDILVDAMSETPESVVVCAKEDGQTTMNRLNPDDLKHWLAKYRLGELWTRGEIGGTRW